MILLTGATGTVGAHLARTLSLMGVRFRIGVHKRRPELRGAELVPIDYDKPETLGPAFRGVEVVYLLSQAISHERAVVTAARRAGVARVVKHSAWRAGEDGYTFGRWHREIEREIEASGLPWTFLRPNGFMQNVISVFGETILTEGAFYDSVGDARISHIDARDIARVAARVLTEPGHAHKIYELSGPEALTYAQMAKILSRVLERPIEFRQISDDRVRREVLAMGVPAREAAALVDLNRYVREGSAAAVTSTVAELTGRAPTTFEQFVREEAAPAFNA